VINVELLSVIRRWHLRDGLGIREISRRTGLSRNTVRKYLNGGVVEPKYPTRIVGTKLDGFAPKLEGWLKAEANKGRKQRRNIRQIFNDLGILGYQGSYDRVAGQIHSMQRTSCGHEFGGLGFCIGSNRADRGAVTGQSMQEASKGWKRS
jgi:hypothetical protein